MTNLLSCQFNQDQGCFSCGMQDGFRVYNSHPLKEKERQDFGNGISNVEMLFRCNYVALVGGGNKPHFSPNKVMIWDDMQKKVVIELTFSSDVTCVRLRRDRIVVVLQSFIKVFTFSQSPQQIGLFETSQNPDGLCQLCPSSNNSILVFPGKAVGNIQVVNLENTEEEPLSIQAHDGPISCLALNLKGNQVATASDKGTLIRIFDTTTGNQINELRRGSGNARIHCINFNNDSTMLCASSDHATVHIFSLATAATHNHETTAAPVSKGKSFLPKYFNSNKSFCRLSLPTSSKSVCAFTSDSSSVIAICKDGTYYRFTFNLKGESTREYFAHFLEMTDNL